MSVSQTKLAPGIKKAVAPSARKTVAAPAAKIAISAETPAAKAPRQPRSAAAQSNAALLLELQNDANALYDRVQRLRERYA